jgi:hypothetical protein
MYNIANELTFLDCKSVKKKFSYFDKNVDETQMEKASGLVSFTKSRTRILRMKRVKEFMLDGQEETPNEDREQLALNRAVSLTDRKHAPLFRKSLINLLISFRKSEPSSRQHSKR